jgi:hypothetical protein
VDAVKSKMRSNLSKEEIRQRVDSYMRDHELTMVTHEDVKRILNTFNKSRDPTPTLPDTFDRRASNISSSIIKPKPIIPSELKKDKDYSPIQIASRDIDNADTRVPVTNFLESPLVKRSKRIAEINERLAESQASILEQRSASNSHSQPYLRWSLETPIPSKQAYLGKMSINRQFERAADQRNISLEHAVYMHDRDGGDIYDEERKLKSQLIRNAYQQNLIVQDKPAWSFEPLKKSFGQVFVKGAPQSRLPRFRH